MKKLWSQMEEDFGACEAGVLRTGGVLCLITSVSMKQPTGERSLASGPAAVAFQFNLHGRCSTTKGLMTPRAPPRKASAAVSASGAVHVPSNPQ